MEREKEREKERERERKTEREGERKKEGEEREGWGMTEGVYEHIPGDVLLTP